MKNVDQELLDIINRGLDGTKENGEFILNKTSDLLEKFYTWHMVMNSLGIILTFTIAIVTYIIGFKAFIKIDKNDYLATPVPLLIHVGTALSVAFLCVNIYKLIFLLVAPDLYLLEYLIK